MSDPKAPADSSENVAIPTDEEALLAGVSGGAGLNQPELSNCWPTAELPTVTGPGSGGGFTIMPVPMPTSDE